jgi:hypothetical protein
MMEVLVFMTNYLLTRLKDLNGPQLPRQIAKLNLYFHLLGYLHFKKPNMPNPIKIKKILHPLTIRV